jgi:hypothetical protein
MLRESDRREEEPAVVFLIIFAVGLTMLIIAVAFGGIFHIGGDHVEHHFDFGGHHELEPHGLAVGDHPSPFNSRILFVFMTAFGGVGYIGQSLGWPLGISAGVAVLGGLAVAGGTFFLVVLPLARQQGSVRVSESDFLHMEGQVTDEIPAGGLGRVALVPAQSGARVMLIARAMDGQTIPFGTAIRVVQLGSGAVTVEPVGPAERGPATPPATRLFS